MSLAAAAAVSTGQAVRDGGIRAGVAHVTRMIVRLARSRFQSADLVEGIRPAARFDRALHLPLAGSATRNQPPLRVALVCHMFYPQLADEVLDVFGNVPSPADIVVTTDTEDKRQSLQAAFAGWSKGQVSVTVTPNRGRDIAPKLALLPSLAASYDLLLFLHTKSSPRHVFGQDWRKHLFDNLVGSPAVVTSILSLFEQDGTLGMLAPQHYAPTRSYVFWNGNFPMAKDLARRMGLRLTSAHKIDFPSGSMFWCRPAALGPLMRLDLQARDFASEQGQVDGTTAHAVERLFFICCELAGMRWIKVDTIAQDAVALKDGSRLSDYHRRYGVRLTGTPIRPATGS